MARFAHFGNARSPTWLRATQYRGPNTDTNTNVTTKHPKKTTNETGRAAPFIRSSAPSPPSPIRTGTLTGAATPGRADDHGCRPPRPSTPPPVVIVVAAAADDDDDDDDNGRRPRGKTEVACCYRTCRFDIEFRLVQRRSGLVAMRRSRKARHRREREYLGEVFRLVGEGRAGGDGEGEAGGLRGAEDSGQGA